MQRASSRADQKVSSCTGRWLACFWLIPAVLALLGYLGLRAAGAYLITGDPLQKADAVVVLGGGDEQRVQEGVHLVQEGYAGWLVLTEPGELEPGAGLGSQILRSQAIENGLSPNAILVTGQVSSSTADEALAVRQLMAEKGFHSVVVVTEPYHTQRTRLIFRRVFAGSEDQVWVYPVQGHWYRSDRWFWSAAGWGHTVREYIKLVGLFLRMIF